ncbi:MAG: EAL domain-containing protein [Cyanobacteria bacterium J06554_6]
MSSHLLARSSISSTAGFSYFRREFQLHYQPIVSFKTGRIHAFEALVRWQKAGMMLYPAEFISELETTGIIIPLGVWILDQACSQIALWQENVALAGLVTSVNLSVVQLRHAGLVESVTNILERTGLKPQNLQLEIPAQVLRLDAIDILRRLESLKELGVRLAIDNFNPVGTPLTSIFDYGIDEVKISHAAVGNLQGNPFETEAFETVIGWFHDLGIQVTLTRVEKAELANFYQALGCDYGQGNLFSQPASARDMTVSLTNQAYAFQVCLDDYLLAVDKLRQTVKRVLGSHAVARYWQETKPVKLPHYFASPPVKPCDFISLPLNTQFQALLEQWVDRFLHRCSRIIRNLPDLLAHSDLSNTELSLLKIEDSGVDVREWLAS